MAEFYTILSEEEIAAQIAGLLNAHNHLTRPHSAATIKGQSAKYFVEVVGSQVVGCTGLMRTSETFSKSFHTSIAPEYRRKGLGRKLLRAAIANCDTEGIYGTVREDNLASLKLVESMGFKFMRKDWKRDHFVYILGRKVK